MAQEILIGIIAPLVTFVMIWVTWRNQRKNLEFNTLLEIFKLLSSEVHRHARESIYDGYRKIIAGDMTQDVFIDGIYTKSAEIVRADFDQIGVFIYKNLDKDYLTHKNADKTWIFHKGYISKELFFDIYSGATVNSWIALESSIKQERETRRGKRFAMFFEKLALDAMKHREKREDDKSEIEKLKEN